MEPVDARHLTEHPEDGFLVMADETELAEEAPRGLDLLFTAF
jgi:hypothetical protein